MINRSVSLGSWKLGADVGGGEGGGLEGAYFYSRVEDAKIELMEGLLHSCGDWIIA